MTSSADRRSRFGEIDYLKSASILVVVFIHVYVTFRATSDTIWWVASATRFAVPAFFFAAGFLTSPEHSDPSRRAVRVLVPYLIASSIAVIWRALAGALTIPRAAFELAMAGAVQPYYFVLDYVLLVFLAPLVAGRSLLLWVAVSISAAGAFASEMGWTVPYAEPPLAPMFWKLRDPLRWAVYFLVGLQARRHISIIETWSTRTRVSGGLGLAVVWLASFLGCYLYCGRNRDELFVALEIGRSFCVIGAVMLLFHSREPWNAVRWLSDATYPIYLYHLLILAFIQPMILEGVLPFHYIENRPMRFLLALLGSIAILILARRLLGSRARVLVG